MNNEPKKTAYDRRKVTEERKKAEGYTKKTYYQSKQDIDLIKQVKESLSDQAGDNKITNDLALAHILQSYRDNL